MHIENTGLVFGWPLRSLGNCVVWHPCPRPQRLCCHAMLCWPEAGSWHHQAPWSWLPGEQNISRYQSWLLWHSSVGCHGQVCVRACPFFMHVLVFWHHFHQSVGPWTMWAGCYLSKQTVHQKLLTFIPSLQRPSVRHNFTSKNGFAKHDHSFTWYRLLVRLSQGGGNDSWGAVCPSSRRAWACPCPSVLRTSQLLPSMRGFFICFSLRLGHMRHKQVSFSHFSAEPVRKTCS